MALALCVLLSAGPAAARYYPVGVGLGIRARDGGQSYHSLGLTNAAWPDGWDLTLVLENDGNTALEVISLEIAVDGNELAAVELLIPSTSVSPSTISLNNPPDAPSNVEFLCGNYPFPPGPGPTFFVRIDPHSFTGDFIKVDMTTNTIPEPATFALLAAGAVMILPRRNKHQSRKNPAEQNAGSAATPDR